jgi:hypothetical protein
MVTGAMLLTAYLARVFHFAFRNFAIRSDLTYGLVSLVAAILVGPEDKLVAELTTHDLGIYAAYTLGIYLLLRLLIVGPYYVWKEEKERADGLHAIVESPARIEREAFVTLRAQKKLELVAAVRKAHICALGEDDEITRGAIRDLAEIEPQAIPDGSLHELVRDFMRTAEAYPTTVKKDSEALRLKAETLMQQIHKL